MGFGDFLKRNWRKIAFFGGLYTWYLFTGGSGSTPTEQKYTLPSEMHIKKATFFQKSKTKPEEEPEQKNPQTLENIVSTSEIDFSKPFTIETDRYTIVNDADWLPSRLIGHVMCIPGKVYFGDLGVGWGLDAKRAKTALALLENDTSIKDITVRLNHNEAFYDWYRMFAEDNLSKRNNLFARLTLGSLIAFKDEIWAEFARGDYYNPMTKTVVVYSNVESIIAHEIGHHQDSQRFDSDWEYLLGRVFPPLMLHQEWNASKHGHGSLHEEDRNQFYRYLIPAFTTYILAGLYLSKKMLQRAKLKAEGKKDDLDKIEPEDRPDVDPLETLRHFVTLNVAYYGALAHIVYLPRLILQH